MRLLFWLLLFIDLALFATQQLARPTQPRAPLPGVQAEVEPDRIRLVLPQEQAPGPDTASAPETVTPASAPAAVPAPVAPAVTKSIPHIAQPAAVAADQALVCMQWGDFSGPNLSRAEKGLSDAGLGKQLTRNIVERSNGYWVYLPPIASQAALNQRVAKLKADGISDYFVVQEAGKWHNAVSLGLFRFRDVAESHLAAMRAGPAPEARLDEYMTRAKLTQFGLRDLTAEQTKKVTLLAGRFTGSTLKTVPCTAP